MLLTHIHNIDGETCWKMSTWKIKRRGKNNINVNLREIGCEDGMWMKPVQDLVQWLALVLLVLNLQVLLS
jgi:hypothetical protein